MIRPVGQVLKESLGGKDSSTLSSFLRVLLETAVIQWFAMAVVVFAAISLAVSLAMEIYFPEERNNYAFGSALSSAEMLVGFLYFYWLNEQRNYTGPLREYYLFLKHIEDLAVLVCVERDAELKELLRHMVLLGEQMYRPGAPLADRGRLPEHLELRMKGANLPNQFRLLVGCTVEHLPERRPRMASDRLKDLMDDVNNIDAAHIREPVVYAAHVVCFLALWFLIIKPAEMWVYRGIVGAATWYPFLMVIVAAPGIYRMWLGSPWSAGRPLLLAKHEQWGKDTQEFIRIAFGGKPRGYHAW